MTRFIGWGNSAAYISSIRCKVRSNRKAGKVARSGGNPRWAAPVRISCYLIQGLRLSQLTQQPRWRPSEANLEPYSLPKFPFSRLPKQRTYTGSAATSTSSLANVCPTATPSTTTSKSACKIWHTPSMTTRRKANRAGDCGRGIPGGQLEESEEDYIDWLYSRLLTGFYSSLGWNGA